MPAVRQKLHLASCADFRDRLLRRRLDDVEIDSKIKSLEVGPEHTEPWPPPVPTRYAIYPRINSVRPDFKTVGAVAEALHAELNRAGFFEVRYWGAPNGFALVTRMEQIDEKGKPVTNSRSLRSPSADQLTRGGIVDALYEGGKALISSPLRELRILLFVVTDDTGLVRHPPVSMTPQVGELWNTGGSFVLSKIDSLVHMKRDHLAAIFVYEFRKDKNGNPVLLKKSTRSIDDHIKESGLQLKGLLK